MFNYKWYMKDGYPAKGVESHKRKVYSTFACGGGSTMGYKLAGYDVIGANDIDREMAKVYLKNHCPKYYDLCPIKDLLTKELPLDYYDLDILDGSPPCSTFSMAGQREKGWKKDKVFREGQSKQVLSDLFFDWIQLVNRLKPKVAVAENVKGMLIGNAKAYTQQIVREINKCGYDVQLFSLNAASMGVPQKRERVFFICRRKDLNLQPLILNFNEEVITFETISNEAETINGDIKEGLTPLYTGYWHQAKPGDGVGKFKSNRKMHPKRAANTLTTNVYFHYKEPRWLSKWEYCLCGSFPLDYKFLNDTIREIRYLIGMSVPPVMTAQIANQIYLQWLSSYTKKEAVKL